MKIGYPCLNYCLDCTSSRTFRLASYSEERMIETITQNLDCLQRTLEYNIQQKLLFFRISSQIIPFASHPVCTFEWQKYFSQELMQLGMFIKEHKMRISMHPDQFNVINSPNSEIVERTKKELLYHVQFLNALGLDQSHKVQIHVGGVYGDKPAALERFISNIDTFPEIVRQRLCIENDERSYNLHDCLYIAEKAGIPIIFDTFHHSLFNNGESYREAISKVQQTWKAKDGVPIIDFSTQQAGARFGKHSEELDKNTFKIFVDQVGGIDLDIMFEIKSKQKAALEALSILSELNS